MDLMATALDVAKAPFPAQLRGAATTPVEGRSLVPLLKQQPFARPGGLYFEHEGNMAAMEGDWKAVSTRAAGGKWALYNLAADRTEMQDVSAQEPERLRSMISRWEAWATRVLVKPSPGGR
jgi:arylsulfatase